MTPQYSVILSKLADDKFNKLIGADRTLGEQVTKAIDRVASNPDLGELLKGEWKGHRKYRTGRYRIIYRTDREQLMLYMLRLTIARISNANPRSRDLSQPFVRLLVALYQL